MTSTTDQVRLIEMLTYCLGEMDKAIKNKLIARNALNLQLELNIPVLIRSFGLLSLGILAEY